LASPVYATSIGLLSMALAETAEPMAYDPNEIVLPESEATPEEAAPEVVLEEGAPEQEGSTKAKPRKDPIWKGFVSGIKQWLEDDDIE
jgi:hypothetical protein